MPKKISSDLTVIYTVKNKKRLGRFFYEFVHFFKKSRHFLTSKVYMSLFKQKKKRLIYKNFKKNLLTFFNTWVLLKLNFTYFYNLNSME